MARVYLETSFVSACVTDRTDAGSVYRREISLEWWDRQARRHAVFTSPEVIEELSQPGFRHGRAALELIGRVPLLDLTEQVYGFAEVLVREMVMPGPVTGDATHVAAACVHAMEYMVTWNVKHLANFNKLHHLQKICLRAGLLAPMIITPDLLLGEDL